MYNNFSVQGYSTQNTFSDNIADAVKSKKRKCSMQGIVNERPLKRIFEEAIDVFAKVENITSDIENFYKKELETADHEEKLDLHYDLAKFYEAEENYPKALEQWQMLSKLEGGGQSFCHMGKLYLRGHPGVEKNDKRAFSCFRKGSKLGCPDADFNIGVAFDVLRSESTSKIEKNAYRLKAVRQYKKIANNKSHVWAFHAEYNKTFLSHLSDDGSFAPKNLEKAKKSYVNLFNKNNEAGKYDSRVPLTCMFVEYLKSKPQDENQEMDQWLKNAKDSGSFIANKISTLKNSSKFKINMEVELLNPTGIYLDFHK